MGYERLSLQSFIKEMKEVTDGAHPRRFCFILGAGASRSSGIKSGQELVKTWDKDLQERNSEEYTRWRNEQGITDENMSSFYSQYYEKRFLRRRSDGYNYMEKMMESAKPSAGYVMLSHLLTTTPHNVVITTNFDHLTEDAVNYYAQVTPLVIGHESLTHYVPSQPIRPMIIKIHRDLLFDPKSRAADLEKLPDSWRNALELVFKNYHPVFIGYAGNDQSLMDFLIENGSKFADDVWKFPYWLLYKNDAIEGKIKQFLDAANGFFIPHDGFDETMIELGAAFNYAIPKENDFLKDARARYKLLKDAIDAFSDRSSSTDLMQSLESVVEKQSNTASVQSENGVESNVNQAIEKITNESEMQRMYHTASILFRDKKYEEAIDLLQKLIELDPDNARYHYKLGDVLFSLKKTGEALVSARKAVELAPSWYPSHYLIAQILETMDKKMDAFTEYRKASELNPDWGLPHYRMGELLAKTGQKVDALVEYRKTTDLDPDWDLAYYGAGEILEGMGQYEEALREFKNAVTLDPDWSLTHYAIAKQLFKLSRTQEALISINKAISLDPNQSHYYSLLEKIWIKLGDKQEADAARKKRDELRNSNPSQ